MKDEPKNRDPKAMQEAVDALNNENGLGNPAYDSMMASLLRQLALEQIYDESVLKKIARQHPVSEVREMAVRRISDQSFLYSTFLRDSNERVRREPSVILQTIPFSLTSTGTVQVQVSARQPFTISQTKPF